MNIFIFDKNFKKSAQWFFEFDFKRANKQILESTEMLAVACSKFKMNKPLTKAGTPYKATRHVNHPCTKWTYSSLECFENHLAYTLALCAAYTAKTGKIHACEVGLREVGLNKFQEGATVDFQFVGKRDYTTGIIEFMNVYEKYTTYIINKWRLQDGK